MATRNSTDKTASGEESPTTARPIDFDDDPQESGVIHSDSLLQAPNSSSATVDPRIQSEDDEIPPPKPPRPLSPLQQAEATLIEAFPTIEPKVVKAVLRASSGQVEPAFNALLGMSDPDAHIEETPPPQPPRPSRQVQQDELYARQLANHYHSSERGYNTQGKRLAPVQPSRHQSDIKPAQEPERSFLDDDLPVIRENVRQGFLQTQTKVNKWISDFRKRIDGDDDAEDDLIQASQPSTNTAESSMSTQTRQSYGNHPSMDSRSGLRRSVDQERYDSDPRVLSDNFTELEMRDEEDTPPRKPHRPLANPDLFKPTPVPPQSGPVDEVEAVGSTVSPPTGKSKKWQPLTSVAPNPETDDNDPFSLGDSDDEGKIKDLRPDDSERLKKAAAGTFQGKSGNLEAQKQSGTRNSDAEKLLSDKS